MLCTVGIPSFRYCKILLYRQLLCMEFSKMEIQYEHWRTLSTVLIICRMFFFLCSIRKADHGYTTTTETLICPGWEILVVPVSQPRTPGRDKRLPSVPAPRGWRTLLSRLVLPTGTKRPFFHIFLFSILFLFQLYFCISIKLIYWNSVCMISTGATPSSC